MLPLGFSPIAQQAAGISVAIRFKSASGGDEVYPTLPTWQGWRPWAVRASPDSYRC